MARGVEAKAEPGSDALFVPAEPAMPVGTRLVLRGSDGESGYRVARVQESAAPGMLLEPLAKKAAVAAKPEPEPEAAEAVAEPEPDGSNEKKGKKGRKRKSTIT